MLMPEAVCHLLRNRCIVEIKNSSREEPAIKRFGGGGPSVTPPPAQKPDLNVEKITKLL